MGGLGRWRPASPVVIEPPPDDRNEPLPLWLCFLSSFLLRTARKANEEAPVSEADLLRDASSSTSSSSSTPRQAVGMENTAPPGSAGPALSKMKWWGHRRRRRGSGAGRRVVGAGPHHPLVRAWALRMTLTDPSCPISLNEKSIINVFLNKKGERVKGGGGDIDNSTDHAVIGCRSMLLCPGRCSSQRSFQRLTK